LGKKVQIFQLTLITSTYAFLYLNYQNGIYSFPTNIINLSYVVNSILAISIISLLINGYTKSAHKAEEELKLTIQNLDLAQKESRSLLLNILPESIADRLTESKKQIADSVEFATILFTDLVGFTPIASKMTAQEVVGILNDIFYEFDSIVERHGLEKIKTIGDGYMVASGVPKFRDDHAISAVQCGFCMLEFLNSFNLKMNLNLGLRIGISSGPIVAGVIGKNKFTYD
jgi:adenylate cyclase